MAQTKTQGRAPSKIELFSPTYFAACTLGGIIACGPTHTCTYLPNYKVQDLCILTCGSCDPSRPRKLRRTTHSMPWSFINWILSPLRLECRSSAAVRLIRKSTLRISQPGAVSTRKKVFKASSLVGRQRLLDTRFRELESTVSMRSSRTSTATGCVLSCRKVRKIRGLPRLVVPKCEQDHRLPWCIRVSRIPSRYGFVSV